MVFVHPLWEKHKMQKTKDRSSCCLFLCDYSIRTANNITYLLAQSTFTKLGFDTGKEKKKEGKRKKNIGKNSMIMWLTRNLVHKETQQGEQLSGGNGKRKQQSNTFMYYFMPSVLILVMWLIKLFFLWLFSLQYLSITLGTELHFL